MNRLFIGLGTIACLGLSNIAIAANGSIAASMTRDHWLAAKRLQVQAAKPAVVAQAQETAPAPLTRPPADSPRPAR